MTFILFPYIFLGIFILVAFYTDITTMQIPNWLNMCGAGGGLLYNFASNGIHGFYASIFGFAVGLGVLLLMYTCKAIGAGDVKLFAAIGAISGAEFVLYA